MLRRSCVDVFFLLRSVLAQTGRAYPDARVQGAEAAVYLAYYLRGVVVTTSDNSVCVSVEW